MIGLRDRRSMSDLRRRTHDAPGQCGRLERRVPNTDDRHRGV